MESKVFTCEINLHDAKYLYKLLDNEYKISEYNLSLSETNMDPDYVVMKAQFKLTDSNNKLTLSRVMRTIINHDRDKYDFFDYEGVIEKLNKVK